MHFAARAGLDWILYEVSVRLSLRRARPGAFTKTDGKSSVGENVSFFREPDAGNPPVRFDERDVKTGHGLASEAPANERAGNR